MRKPSIALLAVCAVSFAAQEGVETTEMLNLNRYVSHLDFKNDKVDYNSACDNKYLREASDEDLLKYGVLAGDEIPDNPLEVALLSYYSPSVKNIRPAQAAAMLPADNPKLSGQKLGAALYQKIQVLRFLGDTAAAGRYDGMLQFVCDKSGVSRAEVDGFTVTICARI
ncbi:MAG: hypothetical protein LBP29_05925 [Treponema sp.]|nr:hypothetical protein [Treponema sp.]